MIKFPMSFEVMASATPGAQSQWDAKTEHLPPIRSAIPPEFMGPGGGYSPEDLFALALLNCLIATFKVYCEMSKTTFQEIHGKVKLTVDKLTGQSGFVFTEADVFFDITGATDPVKVRKLLDASIKDCAVSNSIKTSKTFHINIS
jgi:uncharacterized OsmC-like protein